MGRTSPAKLTVSAGAGCAASVGAAVSEGAGAVVGDDITATASSLGCDAEAGESTVWLPHAEINPTINIKVAILIFVKFIIVFS
jgi:hypothetical protein